MNLSSLSRCARFGCILALALSITGTAMADGNIVPIQSNPLGTSYGEWSARFWQWAFSLPVDHHPLYDTADISAGQTGNVWFLGGAFTASDNGSGSIVAIANRTGTIPAGTWLFFPVLNAEASTAEGNGTTEAELRAMATSFMDIAGAMSCEIDGVPVADLSSYRVQSPLYTFGPLPDNNILQSFGLDAPAGTTSASVADGVQLMLTPMTAGLHTIHFHGEIPDFNFLLDITYNLTVRGRARGDVVAKAGDPGVYIEQSSWSTMKELYRP